MFSMSSVGSSSYQQNTLKTPNLMNRFVRWMKDDEVPQIAKISAVALGAVALIGVAFLSGYPTLVLGFSAVAVLPLAVWASREYQSIWWENILKKAAEDQQKTALDLKSNLDVIKASLKAKEFDYDRLPVFSFFGGINRGNKCPSDEEAAKPWETFLEGRDMASPIKKGYTVPNSYGVREFIAIRVTDSLQGQKTIVLIAYVGINPISDARSYMFGIRISNGYDPVGDNNSLGWNGPFSKLVPDSKSIIEQILNETHPRFQLSM